MKFLRYMIIGLVGVSVAAVLVVVVRHSIRTNPQAARLAEAGIPVRVVPAGVRTLTEVIGASGQVEPLSYIKLTARVEEKVEEVEVDLGEIVVPDQALIEFEKTLLQVTLDDARENLNMAHTAVENSRLFLQRMSKLYEEGLISKVEIEEASLKLDAAKTQYSQAVKEQTEAKGRLENATVKAPIAGIVTERFVNPGEAPRLGAPLLTLGRLDSVLMGAQVVEEKLGSVNLGQSAEVSFEAFPNEVKEGTVWKIDPKVDSQKRTFLVYIKLDNPALRLKPGMTGFARIKNQRSVLAVPSVAIINPFKDQATLFVVDQSHAVQLRPVMIGLIADGMTQIISGIEEGELVVTAGQLGLKDRDRVRIATEKFE